MDLTTFEDGLERHGADLATWPVGLQAPAAAFLERSLEARAAHEEFCEIEGLLRADRPAPVALDGMAARAMRHCQERHVPLAVKRAGWAVAAVVALALGLVVGGSRPDHEEGPDHVMAAVVDQLGQVDVD